MEQKNSSKFVRKGTEATRFLLPMLGTRKHRDWFFVNEYFIDAYIGDTDKPEHNGSIILKYIYYPSKRFIRFERELLVMRGANTIYEHDDMSVMYVFKVPEEQLENYVKFLSGKYSEFSINYKLQILKFWNVDYGDTHLLSSVLFEDKRWRKPSTTKEIHHYDKTR